MVSGDLLFAYTVCLRREELLTVNEVGAPVGRDEWFESCPVVSTDEGAEMESVMVFPSLLCREVLRLRSNFDSLVNGRSPPEVFLE